METENQTRINRRRHKTGVVTSDKMQKTVVVRVSRKFLEPKLGKVVERFVKFKVHDENNEAKAGDLVDIEETRPLSRDKRWRLISVLKKNFEKVIVRAKSISNQPTSPSVDLSSNASKGKSL